MRMALAKLPDVREVRRELSTGYCDAFATMPRSITTGASRREVANDALNRMEVDTFGLDEMDRKLLFTIIEKFNGGPVGLGTISASIHEEKDSIEEIIEPYLIQIGFLDRTPRGRMATRLAYDHFGIRSSRLPQAQPVRFSVKNLVGCVSHAVKLAPGYLSSNEKTSLHSRVTHSAYEIAGRGAQSLVTRSTSFTRTTCSLPLRR